MKTIREQFGLSQTEAMTLAADEINTLIRETRRNAQLDILNWIMKVCGSGQTTGMIRKLAHNKFVEIAGEGEKA